MAKKVKNKTHKGLKKVTKKTANGYKMTSAGGNHKSGKKSTKITRRYAKSSRLSNSDHKRVKEVLGK